MRTRWFLIGLLFSMLGLIAYLIWLAPKVPGGKVLVAKAYLDSLADIANQPPTIIEVVDTFWRDTIIYFEKKPPMPNEEEQFYTYSDSLETPEVKIWLWDRVNKLGIIEERKWAYRLFVPIHINTERTIFQPVPKPYPIFVERNYQRNPKIRYYGMVGFGTQFTIDGGVIYKDRLICGMHGGKDLAGVKLGLVF